MIELLGGKSCKILRMDEVNEALIIFFGKIARVICDRKCSKAWGINSRPKVQLSDDEDDYCYLADYELGSAPEDPGTLEDDDLKPISPNQFPNKWCVRECERCNMSNPNEYHLPLEVRKFGKRWR